MDAKCAVCGGTHPQEVIAEMNPCELKKKIELLMYPPNEFAKVVWTPEDVQGVRPTWSIERCADELDKIEKHMRDRMIELGWDVMETLLDQS